MPRPTRSGSRLTVRLTGLTLLLIAVALPAAGQATLTIADGRPSLLRASRYAVAPGVALQPGDVLEVPASGLAQIEWSEGVAIALGPGARAMLMPGPAGAGRSVFALEGPVKVTGRGAGRARLTTAHGTVVVADATVVVRVGSAGSEVFAETGSPAVESAAGTLTMKPGSFAQLRPGGRPTEAPRPPAAFAAALPPAFLDPLPAQLDRFKGRAVAPMTPREFTYAEVEGWLTSVPAVRRVLAAQWRARAQDPAFRRALLANMKRHPEWERVVTPADPPGPAGPGAVPR